MSIILNNYLALKEANHAKQLISIIFYTNLLIFFNNISIMGIKNRSFLFAISIVISFGSFVFGYALVSISMMSDSIQETLKTT
jgi:hypothetical protein